MSETAKGKLCIQKRVRLRVSNLIREHTIFLIIVLFMFFVHFCIYVFLHSIFYDFLAEFTATFLGILIGFNLERYRQSWKKNQDKKNLLRDLHDELEEIKGKLFPQTKSVLMLYPDIWDSAISSGQLRLLNSEKVRKLTKVYRRIKGTQYEAEWVRRAIEEFNSVPKKFEERRKWLKNRYEELWTSQFKRGEKLSAEIDEILQEKWWDFISKTSLRKASTLF